MNLTHEFGGKCPIFTKTFRAWGAKFSSLIFAVRSAFEIQIRQSDVMIAEIWGLSKRQDDIHSRDTKGDGIFNARFLFLGI